MLTSDIEDVLQTAGQDTTVTKRRSKKADADIEDVLQTAGQDTTVTKRRSKKADADIEDVLQTAGQDTTVTKRGSKKADADIEDVLQTAGQDTTVTKIRKKRSKKADPDIEDVLKTADLGLSVFCPRKDQWDLCVGYHHRNIPQEEYDAHVKSKDRARAEKDENKKPASSFNHLLMMEHTDFKTISTSRFNSIRPGRKADDSVVNQFSHIHYTPTGADTLQSIS
ncbi:hypothetical protein PoB_006157300 [Plakobranchus ocellatus]|uniref:Uncharacterized protein n=1 Tax=Plakobranchus ocellatus TaxID=259542 RepID=A0AAV4CSZ8_9GAST|nr:hypothetical protein PoB_006157300 [Plakobranchus ocellatus]